MVNNLAEGQNVTDRSMLFAMGIEGNAGELTMIDAPIGFSNDVKNAAYLRDALNSALKCSICDGYLHTIKAVSYDHKKPVRDGGVGISENIQLIHPYCNTGLKN